MGYRFGSVVERTRAGSLIVIGKSTFLLLFLLLTGRNDETLFYNSLAVLDWILSPGCGIYMYDLTVVEGATKQIYYCSLCVHSLTALAHREEAMA